MYSVRLYYLFGNSSHDYEVNAAQLADIGQNHEMMSSVRESWGLELYSEDTILGIGAILL